MEPEKRVMADTYQDKNREVVEPIELGVLGGTFIVKEVIVEPGQTRDGVVQLITDTPTDRWFVILAETEGTTQDVLALIDDEYEFQFIGLGTLQGD